MNDFPSVRFGLLVGVGGGVPSPGDDGPDIRLGDVVVSKPAASLGGVVQYDLGKYSTSGGFERTGVLTKPPALLRSSVENLAADDRMKGSQVPKILSTMLQNYPAMEEDYSYPGLGADRLFQTDYPHVEGPDCRRCDQSRIVERTDRRNQHPKFHYGVIGSANLVVKDARLREELRRASGILCVEMEAAGLMDSFPCLVIRGICDYADSHKNKAWQPYAAAVAAAYMKELLMIIPPQQVVRIGPAEVSTSQGGRSFPHYLGGRANEAKLISSSLHFAEIHARYEDIDDAHPATFEWILEPTRRKKPQWDSFVDWVKNEEPVYWISGIPGSGKSTLMKYLVKALPTTSYWNHTTPLLLSFWFWEAGQELERSLVGCIRSLIWQLLEDERSRNATVEAIGPFTKETWTKHRLKSCLLSALKRLTPLPLLIFLDGVDEAGPEAEALLDMVQVLATEISGVKLCVSSRPEQLFVDNLSTSPKLRMQDLNRADIDIIIREDLLDNPKILSALTNTDQLDLLRLKGRIALMAQGVILWVKLVIKSLLQGLRNRDTIEMLQSRLEELPVGLDTLYEHMLRRNNSGNPYYAELAAFYFKLVDHWDDTSVPHICLATNHDLRKRYLDPGSGWDMTTLNADFDCDRTITWINVRTAGLLEVSHSKSDLKRRGGYINHRRHTFRSQCLPVTRFLDAYDSCSVHFIHRTARTYIFNTILGRDLLSKCTKTDGEWERICFETILVKVGVFRGLERSMLSLSLIGLILAPHPGTKCNCTPHSKTFERVCNGFLQRGRITIEPFWMPGMESGSLDLSPCPCSTDGMIDFCQLYCMFSRWDNARHKLSALDGFGDPRMIEKLSVLLVFVAYGNNGLLKSETNYREGVEVFLWLLANGADPNHTIITPNDEEIYLWPYLASSLGYYPPAEIESAVIGFNFTCTPKYLPTMSSCSEIFWDSAMLPSPFSPIKDPTYYCLGDVRGYARRPVAREPTSFLSRIYALCAIYRNELFPVGPVLYPVSSSDSERIIPHLAGTSPIIGIKELIDSTKDLRYIRDILDRDTLFSSLSEAFLFMGKTPGSIQKWAIAEEAKLRRRRESEDDISRWKSWVFGDKAREGSQSNARRNSGSTNTDGNQYSCGKMPSSPTSQDL